MKRAAGIGLSLVACLGLACTSDGDAAPDREEPPESAEPATAWPTAGFDLSNSRAIAGGDLHDHDRRGVVGAMDHGAQESLGTLSTVPIVVDGVVYVQGGKGQVAALELDTGDTIWLSTPTPSTSGPSGWP